MKKTMTLAALLTPTAAFAHGGHHNEQDFMSGILHMISQPDHVAMIAVGLVVAGFGVYKLKKRAD